MYEEDETSGVGVYEEHPPLQGQVLPRGVDIDEDEDEDEEPVRRAPAAPKAVAAAPKPGAKPQTSKQLHRHAAKHLQALHEKAQQLQDTFDALATATDVELMQKQLDKMREERDAAVKGAALIGDRHREADVVIADFVRRRDQRRTWEEQTHDLEKALHRVSDILSGRGDPDREARKKLYTLDEARCLLGAGR